MAQFLTVIVCTNKCRPPTTLQKNAGSRRQQNRSTAANRASAGWYHRQRHGIHVSTFRPAHETQDIGTPIRGPPSPRPSPEKKTLHKITKNATPPSTSCNLLSYLLANAGVREPPRSRLHGSPRCHRFRDWAGGSSGDTHQ